MPIYNAAILHSIWRVKGTKCTLSNLPIDTIFDTDTLPMYVLQFMSLMYIQVPSSVGIQLIVKTPPYVCSSSLYQNRQCKLTVTDARQMFQVA